VLRLRAAGLRAVERVAVVPVFFAAGRLATDRFAAAGFAAVVVRVADAVLALLGVERLAAGLRRVAVLRAGLRAAVERAAVPLEDPPPPLALLLLLLLLAEPSIENLPDMTRCSARTTCGARRTRHSISPRC